MAWNEPPLRLLSTPLLSPSLNWRAGRLAIRVFSAAINCSSSLHSARQVCRWRDDDGACASVPASLQPRTRAHPKTTATRCACVATQVRTFQVARCCQPASRTRLEGNVCAGSAPPTRYQVPGWWCSQPARTHEVTCYARTHAPPGTS